MRVTVKDIAKKAGVSIGTVDRALNNRADINPATREKVLAVADALGYRPNLIAKTLSAKRAPVRIAVVTFPGNDDFFGQIHDGVRAAEKELEPYGVKIDLFEMKSLRPAEQIRILNQIDPAACSGLAVSPVDHPGVRDALCRLRKRGLPVITLNTDLDGIDRLGFVGQDLRASGRIAAQLCARTLREGESAALFGHLPQVKALQERLQGFRDFMRETGGTIASVSEDENDEAAVERRALAILRRDPSIRAVCQLTTRRTIALIRAVRRLDRDVNVVCFDRNDAHLALLRNGGISFLITQDPFRQGYLPVKMLFELLYFHTPPEREIQYTRTEILVGEMVGDF